MIGVKQQLLSLPCLSLILPALPVLAFTFTNTVPTQCDPLTVNWTGGQPPFQLLMIAPNRPMYNFTIPSSSFNNNIGSFTIPQLLLPQFQRVMFSMSDATGVSSGGITTLLTVGDSVGNVICNTTSASPDFVFTLGQNLEECKPFEFSNYPNAVQPVTIFGFIPNGKPLALFPPFGDHFDFNNNLTAGTTVVFYMEDSLGRDGGVADIDTVSLSDVDSCVSSTSGFNSTTPTSSSLPPTTTGTSTGPTSKSSNMALIAGSAAGGGFAVVLLGLVVGCCICRRRRRHDSLRSRIPIVPKRSSIDLLERADQHSLPDITLPHHVVVPFAGETSSSTSSLTATRTGTGLGTGGAPTHLSPLSSKQQMRMALMNGVSGVSEYSPSFYASSQPSREGLLTPGVQYSSNDLRPNGLSGSTQRVIVHTDIAEAQMMDDEPLELPPMYSETRRPIPGLLSSDIPTSNPSSTPRSRKAP